MAVDFALSPEQCEVRLVAVSTKVFASETAVQVVWDCMRVVGVEAHSRHLPLAGLVEDVIAYALSDGSNMGVRRRQLHALLRSDGYEPLAAMDVPEPSAIEAG